jgi:predicted Zn-dependent protease
MLGFLQGWDETHPGTRERIEALSKRWKSLNFFERKEYRGRLK